MSRYTLITRLSISGIVYLRAEQTGGSIAPYAGLSAMAEAVDQ
ncbi:hypothetical protein [Brucella intermedia]|nr:hypothetical protein [Brucella intermedia]